MRNIIKFIQILLAFIFGFILFLILLSVFEYKFYHLILFLIFLYIVNVLIHEIGHMVFGKIVKINTRKIQIGLGPKTIFKFKILNTPIEITNRIGGGFSFPDDFDSKKAKIRIFVYTLGGAFFNISTALLAYFILKYSQPSLLNMELKVFLHSNILTSMLSLVPFKINSFGISQPNDGLRLIQCFFYNEKQIQQFSFSGKILESIDLMKKRKYAEAKVILEKIAEKFPEDVASKINIAYIYIKELETKKAQKIYKELLNNLDSFGKNYKYIIMNNLAYLSLFDDDNDNELAEDYSKQVYSFNNKFLPFAVNRGCILVNSGKTKEGIAVLKRCVNLKRGIDKFTNNAVAFIYLAYGFYKKNNIEKAIAYIEAVEAKIDTLDRDEKYLYDKIINKTNDFDRNESIDDDI
jgi:tetratricopeptide (TPR) repeat protein